MLASKVRAAAVRRSTYAEVAVDGWILLAAALCRRGTKERGAEMAERVIFIGFSNPVRGREQASAKVFQEAADYWGRLQAAGEIEGVDAVLLDPHGGDLGGFFLLKGEGEKLARLSASEEFQRLALRANLLVERFGIVGGAIGEGVNHQMAAFLEVSASLTD